MSITIKIAVTTALAVATLAPAVNAQGVGAQDVDAQSAVALHADSALAAPILVATPVPEPPRTRKFRVSRTSIDKGTAVPQPPNKRRSYYRGKFNPGSKVRLNPQPVPPRVKGIKR